MQKEEEQNVEQWKGEQNNRWVKEEERNHSVCYMVEEDGNRVSGEGSGEKEKWDGSDVIL